MALQELNVTSNQGQVYLAEKGSRRCVVKESRGGRLARRLRRAMIRREFRIYRRLAGIRGVPECYGLEEGERLLLECLDARSMREARDDIPDPEAYFAQLHELIQRLHDAGVAHADLKRKENILLGSDGMPYLIDFGSSVVLKESGGPVNRYLFEQACQLDWNAWVKLKYRGLYDELSEADRRIYRPTLLERTMRPLKNVNRRWRQARRRARGD